MADIKTAEQISRKVRALKYFQGVIETADKKGSAIIKLNCTGAEFKRQQACRTRFPPS